SYDVPEPLIVQTPKGKITVSFHLNDNLNFFDSVNLGQTVNVEVEPSNNISLEDLTGDFISPFGNLISLGMDVRNCLTNLYVFNESTFFSFNKDERTPTEIEVYFRTERPVKDK